MSVPGEQTKGQLDGCGWCNGAATNFPLKFYESKTLTVSDVVWCIYAVVCVCAGSATKPPQIRHKTSTNLPQNFHKIKNTPHFRHKIGNFVSHLEHSDTKSTKEDGTKQNCSLTTRASELLLQFYFWPFRVQRWFPREAPRSFVRSTGRRPALAASQFCRRRRPARIM